jgi:hypothetical protein
MFSKFSHLNNCHFRAQNKIKVVRRIKTMFSTRLCCSSVGPLCILLARSITMLKAQGTNSAAMVAQIPHLRSLPQTEIKRLHLLTPTSLQRTDLTTAVLEPNITRCATQDLQVATQTVLKLSVILSKVKGT